MSLSLFLEDEGGVTAIEYALIAAMLSVAVVASAFLLGGGVKTAWTYVANEVVGAVTAL